MVFSNGTVGGFVNPTHETIYDKPDKIFTYNHSAIPSVVVNELCVCHKITIRKTNSQNKDMQFDKESTIFYSWIGS